MARQSASTPAKRAKLRELRARGLGLRPAAKAVGVSHETARSWERLDAARAAGRKPPATCKPALAVAADAAAAAEVLAAGLPSPGDPEALSTVRARAALVGALLRRLTPAVETGEFSPTAYVTLARYGDDLARLIHELTPPAPKDPNEDLSVLEAERTLLAKLEGMVADAESRTEQR
jgi:hypothetical protein